MLPAFKHVTLSINVANLRTHNIFHMQCFNRQKALFLNGLLDQLYVHSMFQYGKAKQEEESLCVIFPLICYFCTQLYESQ